jgi:hypothetical protein
MLIYVSKVIWSKVIQLKKREGEIVLAPREPGFEEVKASFETQLPKSRRGERNVKVAFATGFAKNGQKNAGEGERNITLPCNRG